MFKMQGRQILKKTARQRWRISAIACRRPPRWALRFHETW